MRRRAGRAWRPGRKKARKEPRPRFSIGEQVVTAQGLPATVVGIGNLGHVLVREGGTEALVHEGTLTKPAQEQ